LQAIGENRLTTSVGGHFMDAAWAIIMLYDHFNGFPLNHSSLHQFSSPISLITANKIKRLQLYMASHNWQCVDFRSRSKAINKQLTKYDFSPASVLKELR
jgi:hypothetical protein